jgi:hypothetical protein
MSVRTIGWLMALLFVATGGQAAEVTYQHPDLTIVAKNEPLDSVLKSLGRAMRIYITVPTGLNPVVTCDIHNQSVKQAFKTLLGDLNYSLEWEDGGERLMGLTILASGSESAATAVSEPVADTQVDDQPEPPAAAMDVQGAAAPVAASDQDIPGADHDYTMEEQQARTAQEREAPQ